MKVLLFIILSGIPTLHNAYAYLDGSIQEVRDAVYPNTEEETTNNPVPQSTEQESASRESASNKTSSLKDIQNTMESAIENIVENVVKNVAENIAESFIKIISEIAENLDDPNLWLDFYKQMAESSDPNEKKQAEEAIQLLSKQNWQSITDAWKQDPKLRSIIDSTWENPKFQLFIANQITIFIAGNTNDSEPQEPLKE